VNWTFAFQLGTAIITSLGGGGAIVFGLSNFLGKLWADRALEREKHKYAEILQNAKSELDKAASRFQVELDSLKLVHTLRTTEEFSHLGKLWKQMAILQDAFKGAAGLGVMLVPEDSEDRKKYFALLRTEYEKASGEARQFFLEEKLFIPKKIADCAESTLGAAIKEKNYYDIFSKHHEAEVRRQYTQNLPGFQIDYNTGMETLEKLMRDHIAGVKLSLQTA
jgi:hypothetical protein